MRISDKLPEIFYGADYNPEQWPESVWSEDIALMKEAGVNLVSVGIFSWARLNPAPGEFTFDWLDRIMDLLADNGIFADLATATASPPVWLGLEYPESLPVDQDGSVWRHGSRQAYTANSRAYQEHAAALVRALADRYKDHPALAMWHINNEYACHIPLSFGPEDARAFRIWLREKYGTIEALNEAWGTAFWSQIYTDFEQIQPPGKTPTFINPSQDLDYKRFYDQALMRLMLNEAEILRAATPDIPVTTNFMGLHKPVNGFAWSEHLDVASWDSYPDPDPELSLQNLVNTGVLGHDLTRSYKKDRPFFLMEQVTSQVNWRPVNHLKRPGIMRLWSLQTVARGGDGVMFFQWRQSKAGGEKFHGAMVPAVHPRPSRVWREVTGLGAELKKLQPVAGSTIEPVCAILLDWESWWAVEASSKPRKMVYSDMLKTYHQAFYEANVPVAFVHPREDLSAYRLIIAPMLYMVDEALAARLKHWVEAGGVLVASWFTGVVDRNDHLHLGGFPGLLQDLFGLWVEAWDPAPDGRQIGMKLDDGSQVACSHMAEIVHLDGARAIGTFSEELVSGSPALTVHDYGQGRAYYLATQPAFRFLRGALNTLLERLNIQPPLAVPEGVEVTLRQGETGRFLFLLNHTHRRHSIELKAHTGVNLLTGERVGGTLDLNARDVAVIQLSGSGDLDKTV